MILIVTLIAIAGAAGRYVHNLPPQFVMVESQDGQQMAYRIFRSNWDAPEYRINFEASFSFDNDSGCRADLVFGKSKPKDVCYIERRSGKSETLEQAKGTIQNMFDRELAIWRAEQEFREKQNKLGLVLKN